MGLLLDDLDQRYAAERLQPGKHSDAGWEWEASKSHYLSNLARIPAAMGLQSAEEYANRMDSLGDQERALSSAPQSWDDMEFGKNFGAYLRQGAISSAPYIAEAAVTAPLMGATGAARAVGAGAVRLAGDRAATAAAERVLASATEEQLASGVAHSAARTAALEARDAAIKGASRGVGLMAGTYPSSLGDVLGNQHEENGSYDVPSALGLAVPYAAMNLLGLEGMVAGVRGLAKHEVGDTIMRRIGRGAVAAGETTGGEALNETGQEFMNQLGRMAVNPQQTFWNDESVKRFKESAIMGGLLGGAGGSLHIGSALMRPRVDETGQRATDLLSQYQGQYDTSLDNEAAQALGFPSHTALQDEIGARSANEESRIAEEAKVAELQQRKQDYLSTLLGQGIPSEEAAALTESAFTPKSAKGKVVAPEYSAQDLPIVEHLKANGFPPKRIKAELKRISALRQDAATAAAEAPTVAPVTPEQRLKERANAVQVGSPAPILMGQGTQGGQAVGQGNAQSLQAAGQGQTQAQGEVNANDGQSLYAGTQGAQAGQVQAAPVAQTQEAQTPSAAQALVEVRQKIAKTSPMAVAILDHIMRSPADYIDAQGVLQHTKTADEMNALGLKNTKGNPLAKGSVASGINTLARHMKALGVPLPVAGVESADAERLGLPPSRQAQHVGMEELFGSETADQTMHIINSIGGSTSAVGKAEETTKPEVTVETVADRILADKNATEAQARAAAENFKAFTHPEAKNAAIDWNDFKSDDAPAFSDLVDNAKAAWIEEYVESLFSDAPLTAIESAQKRFENELEPNDVKTHTALPGAEEGIRRDTIAPGKPEVLQGPEVSATRPEPGAEPEAADITGAEALDTRFSKNAETPTNRDGGLGAADAMHLRGKDWVGRTFDFLHREVISGGEYGELQIYHVHDKSGKLVGQITLGVRDAAPNALYWIEAFDEGVSGEQMLRGALAASQNGLYIVNMLPDAVGFWQAMGTQKSTNFKTWEGANGFLDGKTYEQARAERFAAKNPGRGETSTAAPREAAREESNDLDFRGKDELTPALRSNVEADTPASRLSRVLENWKHTLDGFFSGEKLDAPVMFSSTPASLQALGLPNLVIRVAGAHFIEDSAFNHGVKRDQLERVPADVANPVMVLANKGADGKWSLNLVTRETTTQGVLVVALQPSRFGRWGKEPVHLLATITPRRIDSLTTMIRNGQTLMVGDDLTTDMKSALVDAQKRFGRTAIDVKALIANGFSSSAQATRSGKIIYKSDLVKMVTEGKALLSTPPNGDLGRAISQHDADETFTRVTRKWGKASPAFMHDSFASAPEYVQQAIRDSGGNENTPGIYVNGEVHVIRDNHESSAALERTLYHEGNHSGLMRELHSEAMVKLHQAGKQLGGQDGLRKIAAKYGMQGRFDQYVEDYDGHPQQLGILVAELSAMLSERHDFQTSAMRAMMVIRRVAGAIRSLLRRSGLVNLAKMNESDLFHMVARANRRLTKEGAGAEKAPALRSNTAVLTPDEFAADTAKSAQSMWQYVKDNAGDYYKRGLLAAVFGHDLVKIAVKEGLAKAQGFFELSSQKDAIRNRLETEAENILQSADSLTDRKAAEAFLRESTISRKWGFQPAWNTAAKVDAAVAARFKALTPQAQQVVKRVFEYGHKTYQAMRTELTAEINQEYDELLASAKTPEEKTALEKDRASAIRMKEQLMPDEMGPYAPLRRFGDYLFIGKSKAFLEAEANNDVKRMNELIADPKQVHYVVEMYDNMGQAKARYREKAHLFESRGGQARATVKQKDFHGVDNIPWAGLQRIKTAISSDDKTMKYKTAMQRIVTELYLQSVAETSARKAEISRKGTFNRAGVMGSDDMFRGFAANAQATAHYVASLSKNKEISQQISEMRSEAKAHDNEGRTGANQAVNEILARYAQGLDYRPTPVVDKMLRVSSIWMLMTSPAYYLQNAMQPFMFSQPYMAGRFGAARAFGELTKAYKQTASFVKNVGTELDIDNMPLSKAEKAMLHNMWNNGKLDIGINAELGRWKNNSAKDAVPVLAKAMRRLDKAMVQVEMLNRVTSALAAYRLAESNPGLLQKGETPESYTASMLDETHGNYAKSNAPRYFHANGLTKLTMQFKKYQLIQISLLVGTAHKAFAAASQEERAVGRATLAWLVAQHMLVTGMAGTIPAALLMVAGALGGDDDKDWERNARKAIGDDKVADFLLHGIPAGLGLDVSRKLGISNAFSLLPFAEVPKDKSTYEKAVTSLSGAFIGGLGSQFADALGQIGKGNYYKGIEELMPRGLRDAMKAYRFATEGVTSRRNDVQLKPDDIGLVASIMQGMGLPTTDITNFARQRGDIYELGQHFKEQDKQLGDDYAKAKREGDTAEQEDIRQKYREHQDAKKVWLSEMARQGLKDKALLKDLQPHPLSTLLKSAQNQAKREHSWQRAGA